MKRINGIKAVFITVLLALMMLPSLSFAETAATAAAQIFEKAKKNANWKYAFVTGKSAQVVFMSISPTTNPKNEIGTETHKFDQVIFVADGVGKAVLDGKTIIVRTGDMIFIPEGTPHNVINVNANKPLKIVSVYSSTDIPANSVYKTMAEVPKE